MPLVSHPASGKRPNRGRRTNPAGRASRSQLRKPRRAALRRSRSRPGERCRASLVLAVAAAEVAIKQFAATHSGRESEAWLISKLPSPSIRVLLKDYMPFFTDKRTTDGFAPRRLHFGCPGGTNRRRPRPGNIGVLFRGALAVKMPANPRFTSPEPGQSLPLSLVRAKARQMLKFSP